jgi:hypothetical protein
MNMKVTSYLFLQAEAEPWFAAAKSREAEQTALKVRLCI